MIRKLNRRKNWSKFLPLGDNFDAKRKKIKNFFSFTSTCWLSSHDAKIWFTFHFKHKSHVVWMVKFFFVFDLNRILTERVDKLISWWWDQFDAKQVTQHCKSTVSSFFSAHSWYKIMDFEWTSPKTCWRNKTKTQNVNFTACEWYEWMWMKNWNGFQAWATDRQRWTSRRRLASFLPCLAASWKASFSSLSLFLFLSLCVFLSFFSFFSAPE